jgi:predicted outer membrane protein
MLRYSTALAALLATASAFAQQSSGSPPAGTTSRPGQSTTANGANQNPSRDEAGNPATRPGQPAPSGNAVPQNEVPGQQPGQANNRQRGQRNRQGQTGGNRLESHVADCLILGNQEEIALLKFGMERTKSDNVKELAQKMMKDHEKAISELKEFASPQHANQELSASDGSDRSVASREARKVPAEDGQGQAGGQGNMLEKLHRMARKAHEECLAMSKDDLSKYEGHEFDQAFLGQQIGLHTNMLAKLKAAQSETSGELSEWTEKAQKTTKEHKDHVEKLMNSLSEKAHSKK